MIVLVYETNLVDLGQLASVYGLGCPCGLHLAWCAILLELLAIRCAVPVYIVNGRELQSFLQLFKIMVQFFCVYFLLSHGSGSHDLPWDNRKHNRLR